MNIPEGTEELKKRNNFVTTLCQPPLLILIFSRWDTTPIHQKNFLCLLSLLKIATTASSYSWIEFGY